MKVIFGTLALIAFSAPVIAQTPQAGNDEASARAWCTAFSDACRESTFNGCGVTSPGYFSCYSQFANGTCTNIRVQCRCMPMERQGKDVTLVAFNATNNATGGQCLNAKGVPENQEPPPTGSITTTTTASSNPTSSLSATTTTSTTATPSSSAVNGANLATQGPGLLFTSAGVFILSLSLGFGGLLL